MFTATSSGRNAGEIKEELSAIDLDLDIGKLCFSPVPYESSCVRADKSSAGMVTSNVSVADVILPAFDSIKFTDLPELKNDTANNSITTGAVDCIWEPDPPGQRTNQGKDTSRSKYFDFSRTANSSRDGDGEEAEVVDDFDKLREPNHSLIVYKSSRRKSVRNTNTKLNQKIESQNALRNYRNIAQRISPLDLNSVKISRKRRSLFPKRARSSVWGLLRNTVLDFEENGGNDPNVCSEKKLGRVRGAQEKNSTTMTKANRKSVQNGCHPSGHITLKIKIGNQSCGMIHVTKDLNASEKSTHILSDITERKIHGSLPGDVVLPHERKVEKVLSSNVSVLATRLDRRGIVEKVSVATSNDLRQIVEHEDGDKLRGSTENRCSDPGTSPDSEVINSVPDATHFVKGLQNTQDTTVIPTERIHQKCLKNSGPDVSVVDVSSLSFHQKKSKKGKKKDKYHKLGDRVVENQLTGAKTTNSAKAPVQLEPKREVADVFYRNDASITTTARKTYPNTYSSSKISKCPSRCVRMTDSGTPSTKSKVCNGVEVRPFPELVDSLESSNSQAGDTLIPCSSGQKFSKCPRAKGQSKNRFEIKEDKANKKTPDRKKIEGKHQIDEKSDASRDLSGVESHLVAGNQTSSDLGETGYPSKGTSGPLTSLQFSPGELRDQCAPTRNAWVLCDDCQKWRRIPATLADQIEETNSGWTCKDNTDIDFADCSIPQEKSNSEINKELEISDGEEDAFGALPTSSKKHSQAVQQSSSWSLIKSNLFLHRNRKTQTIDEVMVCHCKPPSDGRMGCGAKCLNRMLNIECVRGTCPCGELCSNQQFQKRKYAKLKWFRCGKKGFGLQALDDVSQGQFLIEYVGEVLDIRAYEARQKEYASQGHKHFYFMTLNGSEVIDACAKGNLGRFINHSCDPNCRTEKWMVNGEVCVGLFAVRDIKKDEEVTFDYNYVRVFGAAAKKCVCGSPNCRGYIGGDPTNSEGIVQGDSDEEFAEPVMTCEDKEMKDDWNDIISVSLRERENVTANKQPENRDGRKKPVTVAAQLESITSETTQNIGVTSACGDGSFNMSSARQVVDVAQNNGGTDYSDGNDFASNTVVGPLDAKKDHGESLSISAPAVSMVETEGLESQVDSPVSLQSEDVMNRALSSPQQPPSSEVTIHASASKSEPNTIESKRKLKYATLGGKEELARPDCAVKTRSPSSIKKGKLKSTHVSGKGTPDVDKSNAATNKSKNSPDVSLNCHVETVEHKLNELLDTEGGISKRKDASRGYLKLLFLTAASGTNGHGEGIQSTRDLSMILDALLKTKSRAVLVDIISKNGLQMLHNIMKRYRKQFNKTPILRKLLRGLEYLATREILTLEHITGGPPCQGVESFRDSILTLTEHGDRQVHQIARNFRDRWIPRHLRRKCFMETNDDKKLEFPQNPNHGRLSVPSHENPNDRVEKTAEPIVISGTVDPSPATISDNGTTETRIRKRKSRWDTPSEEENPRSGKKTVSSPCEDDSAPPGFSSPHTYESAPPGFSPACNGDSGGLPPGFSSPCKNTCINPPLGTVMGFSQPRFVASMPVSYGVSYSVMRQFGLVKAEDAESRKVVPGLPFHPFPPLPPYKKIRDPPPPASKSGPSSESAGKLEQGHISGQKRTIAQSMDSDAAEVNVSTGREFQRDAGGSYSLGRKFFRQQKWNHTNQGPPWVRKRNGSGRGGHTRNSAPSGVGPGNGANQFRNSYN